MRFQCPFCRGIVAVDNTDLGIDVQCGHCNEIVTVPYSRVATGAVISDFIILEELGRGGMGVVYLAHQISLDRPAALKVLADSYANNAEFVVGFIKEARAAAKLNHPHIVQAYAVGEDEGIFYFAMENVDGETMKTVLKREKIISVEQGVLVIQQIAEALDYAWKEQRLIHRDIKPDNIMLTSKNNRAKLADLGLARVATDLEDSDSDEVMGTPQYISPEHLTGAPMDVRSDIYSLGATFYHLLTGRFPFEGRTATEIARKHLEAKLVPPNKINPNIPESVSLIIQKMMKKNIKDRYQDAEELVNDLRQVRRGKSPTTATAGINRTGSTIVGKKAVFIKSQKTRTGQFQSVVSDSAVDGRKTGKMNKASGTGTSLKSTHTRNVSGTDTGTGTDVYSATRNLKRIRAEKTRKKMLVLIVLCVVAAVIVLGVVLWRLNKKKAVDDNKVNTVKTPAPVTPPVPVATGSEFSREVDQVLAYAKKNPKETGDILFKCDDFLLNYRPDLSNQQDVAKFDEFQAFFIPLDEKERLASVRETLRKQHLELLETRKEKYEVYQQQKEEQERLKKQKQERLAQEKERQREQAEEMAKLRQQYIDGLQVKKDFMRKRYIDYVKLGDYQEAEKIFSAALKEPERAASKSKEEKDAAEQFAAWGKKMQKMITQAKQVHEVLFNGGDKLAGNQVEIKSGSLGKITSITNGVITAKTFTGDVVKVDIDKLSNKQFARLVRKAAGVLDDSSAGIAYFMCNGEFAMAKAYAETDEEKKEISASALQYLKYKLDKASKTERSELYRKYRRLSEYAQARESLKEKPDSEE
jgi:serine/threonine protein kinase